MPTFPHDHRDLQRDPFAKESRREQPESPPSAADTPAPPPPRPPGGKDDEFDAPESESFQKLVRHVVDEMPGHVVVAFFLVAFMFFYGMANSLFKLTGRDLASIDFPLGVVTGALGSIATTALILRIKYRKK